MEAAVEDGIMHLDGRTSVCLLCGYMLIVMEYICPDRPLVGAFLYGVYLCEELWDGRIPWFLHFSALHLEEVHIFERHECLLDSQCAPAFADFFCHPACSYHSSISPDGTSCRLIAITSLVNCRSRRSR